MLAEIDPPYIEWVHILYYLVEATYMSGAYKDMKLTSYWASVEKQCHQLQVMTNQIPYYKHQAQNYEVIK